MTPYQFGRFIKCAIGLLPSPPASPTPSPVKPAPFEINLDPDPSDEVGITQVGPGKPQGMGRSKFIPPAAAGMLQPGNKGGNIRPAIKRERHWMHGKPPALPRLRPDVDGNLEVFEPLHEWETKDNRT